MVIDVFAIKERARKIAEEDRKEVTRTLDEVIERAIVAQAGSLDEEIRVIVYNPAGLVERRLPYIPYAGRMAERIFNERLKGSYEYAGWTVSYEPEREVRHDNVECTGCIAKSEIVLSRKPKMARIKPKEYHAPAGRHMFTRISRETLREPGYKLSNELIGEIERKAPKDATHYFVEIDSKGEIATDCDGDMLVEYYKSR